MDNNDCKCFVRICSTKEEIRRETDKFINYLKTRDYKGIIRSRFYPTDYRIDLDCNYEVHFVLSSHYGRWCLGRTYKFLGDDDFERLFRSGYEVDKGVS